MSTTVIVVGNDPNLLSRIERPKQGRRQHEETMQVEILAGKDIASLSRKRPSVVVLDVRSPDVLTFEAITHLKSRIHPLPMMLQVTPRQMADTSWSRLFSTTEMILFTRRTSKKEVQSGLQSLLDHAQPSQVKPTERPTNDKITSEAKLTKKEWQKLNGRRLDLIFKKRDQGLNNDEQAELAKLQDVAEDYINRVFPLPFGFLTEFEEAAKQIAKRD